jgi:hypothetical protein
LNRSSVVRAVITALSKRSIRFSGARTENDISQMIGRALDHYLNSRAPAKTNPKPTAPVSRQQPSAGANRVGTSNGSGKPTVASTVQPPVDQDDEVRDPEAFDLRDQEAFDRYMESRGCVPRSGYATYRPGGTASTAGGRAKVEAVRASLERGFAGGGR